VVYLAPPLRIRHGINHLPLGSLLFAHKSNTTGTQWGDNATVILGEDAEPQPDSFLESFLNAAVNRPRPIPTASPGRRSWWSKSH
jgi:hypothetical protein